MAVIGIDLGTTNSCISVFRNNKAEIITDVGGRNTVPSIISFVKQKDSEKIEKVCGQSAYQQMLINTENTIYCIKRFIGLDYDASAIRQMLPMLPYKVIPKKSRKGIEVAVPATGKTYSPEEISSFLLTELRAIAERYLGEPVSKAVITVPAYFNNKQRQATKDAALIAGLDVARIINEPTAAAIAYGFTQASNEEKRFAVFDFGGGTFDITIMDISRGTFHVIATAGNTFLGGEDITNALFEYLINELVTNYDIDDVDDKIIMQRLHDYAESAKKNLTFQERVTIEIPYLKEINGEFIHFKSEISRETLNRLASPFIKKAIQTFHATLDEMGLSVEKLDGIILIGGQTRMPLIQQELAGFCPGIPVLKNINPDETVAMGAAIQAAILNQEENADDDLDMLLLDVTPLNLGIVIGKDMFYTLIPKNSTVPTSVDDFFVTSHDNQDKARIILLQGESQEACENELLGEFELTNLRKAPRGQVKIKITYEIDINGIVTVEAVDMDTDQKQKITVAASSNLSQEELSKKIEDNSDYYLELAEKSIVDEIVGTIENELYELEKLKPQLIPLFSDSSNGQVQMEKMEYLLSSTKEYLRSSDLDLGKLQDIETKLDALRSTYQKLLYAE